MVGSLRFLLRCGRICPIKIAHNDCAVSVFELRRQELRYNTNAELCVFFLPYYSPQRSVCPEPQQPPPAGSIRFQGEPSGLCSEATINTRHRKPQKLRKPHEAKACIAQSPANEARQLCRLLYFWEGAGGRRFKRPNRGRGCGCCGSAEKRQRAAAVQDASAAGATHPLRKGRQLPRS
jgi:hypothetical protein